MGTVKSYLDESELAAYGKAFPTLQLPPLGTNTEGYLRTIALCAIEQLRFLNTYASIPVETLYENIGQKHKASKLAVMSLLRKTGELPEDESKFPDTLWKAQNELLERQISYLKDIKDTYANKRQDLPQGFSMRDFVNSEWFEWAMASLLKLIPGDVDDAIYALVQKHALKTIAWALVWLQKAYYAGSLLCAAMADENAYLIRMTPSYENYQLRAAAITQHDQSIQSLLQQVSLAESQAARTQTDDAEKEFFKREALSERVFECPYSGLCLGEKNGVADLSEFDINTA